MIAKNFNKLEKLEDPNAVLSMLEDVQRQQDPVLIWKKVEGNKEVLNMRLRTYRKAKKEIEINSLDKIDLASFVSNENAINVYLPTKGILFSSKIKSFDSQFILLSGPDVAAMVERRKSLRVSIEDEHRCHAVFYKSRVDFEVRNQFFSRKLEDLSSGGLSLLVSQEEAKFFDLDEKIAGVGLVIGDCDYEVSATVRTKIAVDPRQYPKLSYRAWKVGLEFHHLTPDVRDFIEKFVLENIDLLINEDEFSTI